MNQRTVWDAGQDEEALLKCHVVFWLPTDRLPLDGYCLDGPFKAIEGPSGNFIIIPYVPKANVLQRVHGSLCVIKPSYRSFGHGTAHVALLEFHQTRPPAVTSSPH